MELTRHELKMGNYLYPKSPVRLIQTYHFKERLEQRNLKNINIPEMVIITNDNLYSARTFDGRKLNSVVVKLEYNLYQNIYLCFNPFDGGLKTVWFRKKSSKRV